MAAIMKDAASQLTKINKVKAAGAREGAIWSEQGIYWDVHDT